MRTRYRAPVLAALLPWSWPAVGCSLVQAKAAFKDGNRLYKEENYRKAIEEYQKAVELKPDFAEAHFYLGSSHQALYRPGKEGDENKMRLDKAIEHYEKSLEVNKARHPEPAAGPDEHARRAHRHLLRPAAPELREGARLRRAAGEGQPERHQEPLRDGEPLREVRPDHGGGGRPTRRSPSRTRPTPRPAARSPPSTTSRSGTRRARSGPRRPARARGGRSSTRRDRDARAVRRPRPGRPERPLQARDVLLGQGLPRPDARRQGEERVRRQGHRGGRRSRSRSSPTTGRPSSPRACSTA